jgi:hypothetical protein
MIERPIVEEVMFEEEPEDSLEELSENEDPDPSDLVDGDDDETETVPCPECGVPIAEDSQRCPLCGHYLIDNPIHKRWWVVVGLILILVSAIWGLFWWT